MKRLNQIIFVLSITVGPFGGVKVFANGQSLSLNSGSSEAKVLSHYGFNSYEFLQPIKKTYHGGSWEGDRSLLAKAQSYCFSFYNSCEDFRVDGAGQVSYWAQQPKVIKSVTLDGPAYWAMACSWQDEVVNYEHHSRSESVSKKKSSSSSDCEVGPDGEYYCDQDWESESYSRQKSQQNSKPVVHKLSRANVCSQVEDCECSVSEEQARLNHEREILHKYQIAIDQTSLNGDLNRIALKLNTIVLGKRKYCE